MSRNLYRDSTALRAISRALITTFVAATLIAAVTAQSKAQCEMPRLPSIESIGAGTDVRGFLHPCVPDGMRIAALRRAWSVNTGIRDFKEIAENDYDFTVAANVPGFGDMDAEVSLTQVAQMFSNPRDMRVILAQKPALRTASWRQLFLIGR